LDLVFDDAAFVFDAGYLHFRVTDLLEAFFFGFEFGGCDGALVLEACQVVAGVTADVSAHLCFFLSRMTFFMAWLLVGSRWVWALPRSGAGRFSCQWHGQARWRLHT